jgi:hypothetical protein
MKPNPYDPSKEVRGTPGAMRTNRLLIFAIGLAAFVILVPLIDSLILEVIRWNTRRLAEEGKQSKADTLELLHPQP